MLEAIDVRIVAIMQHGLEFLDDLCVQGWISVFSSLQCNGMVV